MVDVGSNMSLQQGPATVFHAEARSRILFFNPIVAAKYLATPQGSAPKLPLPDQLHHHHHNHAAFPSPRHGSNGEITMASDNSIPIGQLHAAWGSGTSSIPDKYTAKALEVSVFGAQVYLILTPPP